MNKGLVFTELGPILICDVSPSYGQFRVYVTSQYGTPEHVLDDSGETPNLGPLETDSSRDRRKSSNLWFRYPPPTLRQSGGDETRVERMQKVLSLLKSWKFHNYLVKKNVKILQHHYNRPTSLMDVI